MDMGMGRGRRRGMDLGMVGFVSGEGGEDEGDEQEEGEEVEEEEKMPTTERARGLSAVMVIIRTKWPERRRRRRRATGAKKQRSMRTIPACS
jgi:hypothetical protein